MDENYNDGVGQTDGSGGKDVVKTAEVVQDEGPWMDVVTALGKVGIKVNNNKNDLNRFQLLGNGYKYGSTAFLHGTECIDEYGDKVDYHKWFTWSYVFGHSKLPNRIDGRKVEYIKHTDNVDGVFSTTSSEFRDREVEEHGVVTPEAYDEVIANGVSVNASDVRSVEYDGYALAFHLNDGSVAVFPPYYGRRD